MNEYQNTLRSLLEITEEIHRQAKSIQTKMEDNDPEHVEALQALVEKRQGIIQQFDTSIQQDQFEWSMTDREILNRLKELETTLQPLMKKLYESFLTQINRVNQTKQVSKKYIVAYQNMAMATDGSYIDKRK